MNIDNILAIHNENFEKKYSYNFIENLNLYNVYEIEEKAYLILLDSIDIYEIFEIACKKEFQRQGFASKLLSMLPKDKDIHLEVNENNIAAINLYEKNDFKKIAIRKNYYANADAIIMCRKGIYE